MEYTISQANRENNRDIFKYPAFPIPQRRRFGTGFFDPTPIPEGEQHLRVTDGAEELHALLDKSFFNEPSCLGLYQPKTLIRRTYPNQMVIDRR